VKIIRVFPRRTSATPDDDLVRIAESPGLFDECDEVHVSVTWTWDLPLAERIVKAWRHVAPVKLGGPATGERGGDFVPGLYLKRGYTITSRGCPNRCWFCSVWKREGDVVRELPIVDGWNVLDDNLLACSPSHIEAVFAMLKRQKRRAEFTGGIEAKRLKNWHVKALRELKPKQLFFAYDTADDLEPLREAGKKLIEGGFTTASHTLRCYVLCGWMGDSFDAASKRMFQAVDAGFQPMAMLYRDKGGKRNLQWQRWAKQWARPVLIGRMVSKRIRGEV
jgi:hypothetical protein